MDFANIFIYKFVVFGKIKNVFFQLRYFDFYQFGFIYNYLNYMYMIFVYIVVLEFYFFWMFLE